MRVENPMFQQSSSPPSFSSIGHPIAFARGRKRRSRPSLGSIAFDENRAYHHDLSFTLRTKRQHQEGEEPTETMAPSTKSSMPKKGGGLYPRWEAQFLGAMNGSDNQDGLLAKKELLRPTVGLNADRINHAEEDDDHDEEDQDKKAPELTASSDRSSSFSSSSTNHAPPKFNALVGQLIDELTRINFDPTTLDQPLSSTGAGLAWHQKIYRKNLQDALALEKISPSSSDEESDSSSSLLSPPRSAISIEDSNAVKIASYAA